MSVRSHRWLCVLLFATNALVGVTLSSAADSTLTLSEWSMVYRSDWVSSGATIPLAEAEANATPLNLPATLTIDERQDRYAVLETLVPASRLPQGLLRFYLEPVASCVAVYINGLPFLQDGTMAEPWRYNNNDWHSGLVPALPDQDLRITLVLASEGGALAVPSPVLSSDPAFSSLFVAREVINYKLYLALGYVNLLIFAFFLLQFVFNRDNRKALLFALANLFFAVYFLRMGDDVSFLPMIGFFALSKASLSLALVLLTLFVLERFPLGWPRWLPWLFGVVGAAMAVMVCALGNTTASVNGWFTISLLPGQVMIFCILGFTIRALRHGIGNAWIVLAGLAWGVGLGTHDIIAMVSGKMPAFWLQGIGIFGFALAMFAAEAVQSLEMARSLERSEQAIRGQQRQLEANVGQVRQAIGGMAELSGVLDQGVAAAGRGVESIKGESGSIATSIDEEHRGAERALGAVENLDSAVGRIQAQVEEQATQIQETAAALEEMMATLGMSTERLGHSATIARQLDTMVQQGMAAVEESTSAMADIKVQSEGITEIMDTVVHIASQTNLLSMNAAIEAAHAGEAGKGFAVIAEEIKRLAQDSAEHSHSVAEALNRIQGSISQGQSVSQRMSGILSGIGSSSADNTNQVEALHLAALEQQEVSRSISKNIGTLRTAANDIRERALDQQSQSSALRQTMTGLVASLGQIRTSVAAIEAGLDGLLNATRQIKNMSEHGQSISHELAKLADGTRSPEMGAQT